MTVLKKFGLIMLLCLLVNLNLQAQNRNQQPTKTTTQQIDAAELIQQSLVKQANERNAAKSAASSFDLQTSRTIKKEIKQDESFGSGVLSWVQEKYSSMLKVLPDQISNVMLYRFIDEWYGVKYRMGGTSKSGIDCSAFVQNLYQYVFGMNLLRTACMQFESARYISCIDDLKEGDLVFFKIGTSRISHVGVYLKNNFFVHSASSKGVSIANLGTAYWAKYFAGGGRIID
ncbi:MAG: C40 family peptidase [Chitinophagaceae bacterium]|nr:C40 family peptidase [Chitinophagaceae bacterium]